MAENEEKDIKKDLEAILLNAHPSASKSTLLPINLQPYTWKEIRLFLSSSFIDTHAERNALIKNVIPNLNREFASRFIRIVPVDLRWGVSKDESCDCFAIQKTCLNALDACRLEKDQYPWFLGLRTERYGWVQDQLMTSDGFENPDKFDWIDTLKKHEKQLSITSLECIHATHPLAAQGSAPTLFFYKRQITNYENIESNLKWVFDFDYVPEDAELDPEVQYQYVKTEKTQMYRDDRNSLDSYLKSLKHVKYSTYDCQYEKGNAMYTCKNEGRKSFGVGYVSELDQFEEKVESDLSRAIKEYFSVPDIDDVGQHELDSIQHENAINAKAANFVGRTDLTDIIWEFCGKIDEEPEYGNNENNKFDYENYDGRSICQDDTINGSGVDTSSQYQSEYPVKDDNNGDYQNYGNNKFDYDNYDGRSICANGISGQNVDTSSQYRTEYPVNDDNNGDYRNYGNNKFDYDNYDGRTLCSDDINGETVDISSQYRTKYPDDNVSMLMYIGDPKKCTRRNEEKSSTGCFASCFKSIAGKKSKVEDDPIEKMESDEEVYGQRDVLRYDLDSYYENDYETTKPTDKPSIKAFNNASSHASSTFGLQKDSLMIIHGEPGCGKSAILAKISNRCLNELRDKGHFVFVHAVDSCPRSNSLEKMLRRLHTNLRKYVKKLTGSDVDKGDECNDQIATLKKDHVKMLEDTASAHPEKLFVILVDAVNQFHESLQAWRMWWLPSKRAPSNLRFVMSSLNEENGTFKNVCGLHKYFRKVEVLHMNQGDAEAMVSKTLEKYNKKLTTEDDWLLGNQMATLLNKSLSPLYLNASTQALRCFGIFEKLSEYIRQLPANVKDLFIFLIKEWSEEYGEQYIKDVTGMLALSRDGLLENEINDILLYNESENDFSYDCSFSRLYDSICGFLAAGGGGYLRFFHDQLKNVVKDKVIPTEKDKEAIHVIFVEFFIKCIQTQLCESPSIKPPPYYIHCLQQVVHHQMSSMVTTKEEAGYIKTLRNIFFIRERSLNDQNTLLQDEYIDAIRASSDDKETIALKQWSKFSQIYSPYIKRFPEWTLNMALNQSPTSYVSIDTLALNVVPMTHGEYPYYWKNAPPEEDYLALKYTLEDTKCCTSSREKNLCAIGILNTAIIMEGDTGSIIHHVSTDEKVERISVVHFSTKLNTLWTGTVNSLCYVWNIDTGSEEWRTDVIDEKDRNEIRWIENVGDSMAVGIASNKTGNAVNGIIQLYDEGTHQVVDEWDIDENTYCYCFSAVMNVIISAHEGSIKLWDTKGSLLNEFTVNAAKYKKDLEDGISLNIAGINSLCAHPTEKIILLSDFGHVQQIDATTGGVIHKVPFYIQSVVYSTDGEKIIGYSWCNIIVFNRNGVLLNKIQGHSTQINELRLGAGNDDLITAALDGSYSIFIPSEADEDIDSSAVDRDIFVTYCEFVRYGKFYVTIGRGSKLSLWNASTQELLTSVEYKGSRLVASLTGRFIVLCPNEKELHFLDVDTLERAMVYDVCSEEKTRRVTDIKLSADGTKCVCTTTKIVSVIDISDIIDIKEIASFDIEAEAVDLHQKDEKIVAIIDETITMLNINTGETIAEFGEVELATYVKFLYNPDRILYGDDESLYVIDMEGNNKIKLKCTINPIFVLAETLNNGQELMTSENDNSISFHDLTSGEVVYTFIDHRSTRFTAFLVYPDNKTILAFNRNGIKYVLEK